MVALGVSNFAIPLVAGRDAYGRLALVQASVFSTVGLVSGAAAQFLIGRGTPVGLLSRLKLVVRALFVVWAAYLGVAASGLALGQLSGLERASAVILAAALPLGTLAYGVFVVTKQAQRLVLATIVNGIGLSALPIAGYLVARSPAGLVVGYTAAFIASGALVLHLARPLLASPRRLAAIPESPAQAHELILLVLVNLTGSVFVWIALWVSSSRASHADVAAERILLSVASATIALIPFSRFVAQNLAGEPHQLTSLLRNAYSALSIAGTCIPAILPALLAWFGIPEGQGSSGALLVSLLLTPHFASQVLVATLVGAGQVKRAAGASVASALAAAMLTVALTRIDVPLAAIWGALCQSAAFLALCSMLAPNQCATTVRPATVAWLISSVSLAGQARWGKPASLPLAIFSALAIAAAWHAAVRRNRSRQDPQEAHAPECRNRLP